MTVLVLSLTVLVKMLNRGDSFVVADRVTVYTKMMEMKSEECNISSNFHYNTILI